MSRRTNKYQAAGHATMAKRGANVGATEKIRECLRRCGALTKAQITELTGIPFLTVSSIMSCQAGHYGGLVSFGKKGARKYALVDSPEGQAALGKKKAVATSAIAGKIEIGRGFRWGAGY